MLEAQWPAEYRPLETCDSLRHLLENASLSAGNRISIFLELISTTQYVDRNREKLLLDSASAKPLSHPLICEDERMRR